MNFETFDFKYQILQVEFHQNNEVLTECLTLTLFQQQIDLKLRYRVILNKDHILVKNSNQFSEAIEHFLPLNKQGRRKKIRFPFSNNRMFLKYTQYFILEITHGSLSPNNVTIVPRIARKKGLNGPEEKLVIKGL
ncbi:hypothetical protein CDAR_429251 [Caerostris darwini]|uniref:Ribosomal protein S10 n=1 Tax=Caerostris darwini TaxID=1538125 RepID=A0AAV4RVE7_9ARAC|nr:hypothetical protein CDAR_429251 [Caerostris darwini]